MPTLDENRAQWEQYDWTAGAGGDEWSQAWGGAESQWFSTILPRIVGWLRPGRTLEIAPGFGRWTQFLLGHCDSLIGVDLAAVCVSACRERFSAWPSAEFHQNDGSDLPMVGTESIDFAFSFDSLVHVDWGPIESYLGELGRVLRPGGVAFLHHSNLAAVLDRGVEPEPSHWRSREVSAGRVAKAARDRGLAVLIQETVNWGGTEPIDCFSLLRKVTAPAFGGEAPLENLEFMREAALAEARARIWLHPRIGSDLGPALVRPGSQPPRQSWMARLTRRWSGG